MVSTDVLYLCCPFLRKLERRGVHIFYIVWLILDDIHSSLAEFTAGLQTKSSMYGSVTYALINAAVSILLVLVLVPFSPSYNVGSKRKITPLSTKIEGVESYPLKGAEVNVPRHKSSSTQIIPVQFFSSLSLSNSWWRTSFAFIPHT